MMAQSAADPVREDLRFGRADSALQALSAALSRNANDPEAHNLRCRVYYQEEQWDEAVSDCEAAVNLAQNNSNFHLWLGRAYGQRAAHSSLISAYQFARKTHTEFEQAVQLDAHNAAALADLGEYDVAAPTMLGGGLMNAEQVAVQLAAVSPAAALNLGARIAESKKEYPAAEVDLKRAIARSTYPAEAWMDLAAFYRRRGRIDEMVAAAHSGAALDKGHGSALVDGASNLSAAGREPETAILWLRQYLKSSSQSELAPAFVVGAQLAELLQQQGDEAAAEQERAAVHALASGYRIPSSPVPAGKVAGL
jgi:tetratricopeptide (TPR) repeat protein